ncbi:hypothetical protein ACFOVU_14465 [Nocardiopsis sediminis]|uniref:DUF3558 domain-containing protein n=1 Tax=Nocardiopsis sediminis TaxID=1778267 RepID=A0ABV8FP85_9ACTN
MPERGPDSRSNQGIRGWRAGLTMLGCGTIAGLSVVGLVVGGIQALAGIAASPSGADNPSVGAGATGEPQETLDPGTLDLCSTTLPTTSTINVTRTDSDEDYVDTAEDEGSAVADRTVSDSCQWTLIPDYQYIDPWELDFSYRANIPSEDGGDPVELASAEFEDRQNTIGDAVSTVESEGDGALADRSSYVYGASADDPDLTSYAVVAQTRSAVYEIRLTAAPVADDGELVPQAAFEHEVDKMITRLEIDLGLWIPED